MKSVGLGAWLKKDMPMLMRLANDTSGTASWSFQRATMVQNSYVVACAQPEIRKG